jgi:hypothetical protein
MGQLFELRVSHRWACHLPGKLPTHLRRAARRSFDPLPFPFSPSLSRSLDLSRTRALASLESQSAVWHYVGRNMSPYCNDFRTRASRGKTRGCRWGWKRGQCGPGNLRLLRCPLSRVISVTFRCMFRNRELESTFALIISLTL